MIIKWLALSALAALLAFAPEARAGTRAAGGTGVSAAYADQDFSARKYRKQNEGWDRTKKYR